MRGEEASAWLRLALGPASAGEARQLLRHFGLPEAIFGCGPGALAPIVGRETAAALLAAPTGGFARGIEASEQWLAADPRHALLTLADEDYPRGLLELADPPPLVFLSGRRELLARPALAVVGSRSATRQGESNAAAFARHLSTAGLAIVSGLARGIDAAAHRGALDGGGGTIAVLGTGIDLVYPPGHRELSARIGRDGLLLTELPPGAPPLPQQFPRRNRLIAGLSLGVLVVEAALQSGSLITARLAGELGREVFALPGSIHSPLARGCHRLIRQGAKLVETAQDILEELRLAPAAPPAPAGPRPAAGPPRSPGGRRLAALGHDPAPLDELAQRAGMDRGDAAAALLELELAQDVERLEGDRYQRLR